MAFHRDQFWLPSCLIYTYVYDLLVTVSRKFAYADDLATLHYANNWQALQALLLRTWQPHPPTFTNGNSSSVQQRLCRQPYIFTTSRQHVSLTSLSTGRPYRSVLNPLNLCIKLDRTFTFRRHLESLRKKLTSRVGLLKRLTGSTWGADATIPAQPPFP